MIKNMQVIIPMTGNGSRFKAAGFSDLKPFIKVHDKPIIEWVVKMFDKDQDEIIFICRQEHIDNGLYTEKDLRKIAPNSKIFLIKNWQKLGPVNDILLASSEIDMKKPVIVSYCDYYMQWNYKVFKQDLKNQNCDGCIPCYSGFHPHLIPKKNLYASCKIDENENLIEIREKFSWDNDKTKVRHSPGIYYFKTGEIMKYYFEKTIENTDHINGEYYASVVYNYLVRDGLKVWCPVNIDCFCQWGTPEDLNEYLFWVNKIKSWKI